MKGTCCCCAALQGTKNKAWASKVGAFEFAQAPAVKPQILKWKDPWGALHRGGTRQGLLFFFFSRRQVLAPCRSLLLSWSVHCCSTLFPFLFFLPLFLISYNDVAKSLLPWASEYMEIVHCQTLCAVYTILQLMC